MNSWRNLNFKFRSIYILLWELIPVDVRLKFDLKNLTLLLIASIFINILFTDDFCNCPTYCEYLEKRTELINEDHLNSFGASLELKGDEIPANKCLMTAKIKEVDEGTFFLSNWGILTE